jgi:hypothetical protein
MKTKLFIIIAGIALIKTAKAQDQIVTVDSSRIQTIVQEVQQNNIKYKLAKNEEGPSYIIAKSSVAYILYKNGTTERYSKPKAQNNLNQYNLDGFQSPDLNVYHRIPRRPQPQEQDNSHLYKRKNYIGINHLAFLNSNISLTFMRDVQKEKLILQIPVSIGMGKPDLTNNAYNGSYLNYGSKNTYNQMNYQAGLGLLFTPSFGEKINFLIGPSLSFTQYQMSTKTNYMIASPTSTNPPVTGEFKNDFTLYRQFYGATVGFMFRMSEKLNMTLTANVGCKKDSYNEKDTFGIEYVNKQTGWGRDANANVLPYANFSWTIGYRF